MIFPGWIRSSLFCCLICAYTRFTVCFKNGKVAYIQFNGLTPKGYYIANKYAIKEYLYDLYYDVENKIAVAMGLPEE